MFRVTGSLRVVCCVVAAALAGCSRSKEDEVAPVVTADGLRRVTLQLNWYPEAEHGGYYAAVEHGFYKEAGLEVVIVKGGPDVPVTQKVAAGQADFGIENADRVLLMRAQEADLVAVMAPLQTSPRCLMVHESSGAKSFGDLGGMTVAMNAGEPFAQFLLHGVLPKDVTVVPFQGSVSHFLRNEKHAQQGYSFSEPFLAEEQGSDPKALLVADAGFNPYSSCLITRGGVVERDPELVEKMVAASVRGWEEYLKNPTPTNTKIHNENPEMSQDILVYGAEAMRPLCVPKGQESQPFGRMTKERWETLAKQMVESGVLKAGEVDAGKAFGGRFVDLRDLR